METKKSDQIVVKDPVIISFYRENPNLNFIAMNHIFIDILKNLSTNLNETLTNTIHHRILSTLTDISKDISGFKQDVTTKLHDAKREYIENCKLLIENSAHSASDKMQSILEKSNESLLLKTATIINDVVPKHNDKFVGIIDASIKTLHDCITDDTHKLIETFHKDEKSVADFVTNIDTRFSNMIGNLQQPIFSFIQSSEERNANHFQQIRDKLLSQQMSQDSLHNGLHEFLNKYKHNSSTKGNVSETELYSILQNIFPSDEIIDCSSETATCDYRVNRLNREKPTILFENKDYTRSVTTEEVKKFERDLQQQKMHGVFISHKSNITFKEPFQIDIIHNLIHIYLPNTDYSLEKIRIAVEIIDTLSGKLTAIKSDTEATETSITVSKEDIDELLECFNEFHTQKTSLIENIKTSNKLILDKIEALQLNAVKKLLHRQGFFQSEADFKCKFCTTFVGKNKASLGAHIRNCKSNPINK